MKFGLKRPSPQVWNAQRVLTCIGKAADGHFRATEMLMKCPSKYNEQNHLLEADA